MLAKSRASAFILTLVALILFLASHLFIGQFFNPLVTPPVAPKAWEAALLVAIILGISYLVSRSLMVIGLDESGFGIRGLLRWSAFGAFTGGLLALYYGTVLELLDEDSFFYYIFQTGGSLGILVLLYWLIFRKNIFTVGGKKENLDQSERFLGWYMFIGGIIVAGVCWLVLILGAFKGMLLEKMMMISSGVVMIGLASILMGTMLLVDLENRVISRLFWLVAGLLVIGIGLALAATRIYGI